MCYKVPLTFNVASRNLIINIFMGLYFVPAGQRGMCNKSLVLIIQIKMQNRFKAVLGSFENVVGYI